MHRCLCSSEFSWCDNHSLFLDFQKCKFEKNLLNVFGQFMPKNLNRKIEKKNLIHLILFYKFKLNFTKSKYGSTFKVFVYVQTLDAILLLLTLEMLFRRVCYNRLVEIKRQGSRRYPLLQSITYCCYSKPFVRLHSKLKQKVCLSVCLSVYKRVQTWIGLYRKENKRNNFNGGVELRLYIPYLPSVAKAFGTTFVQNCKLTIMLCQLDMKAQLLLLPIQLCAEDRLVDESRVFCP